MAALNSQTHTYTRTRLRFLCLQVCFLIWSGCTDQINRIFSSCFHMHKRELNSQMTSTDYQTGKGWEQEAVTFGGHLLRGDEPPPHSAGYMLQEKKKKGKKNSWPSGTCQSNYPSHVNKSKPRGTAVEPSNTNTQTEFTWIPGFSRS